MNRRFIIKPGIHRRCQVAMCTNMVSNSIARTDAPAGANLLICDDCLREAYAARFGTATPDTDTKDETIRILAARIHELEERAKSDASAGIHIITVPEADTAPQAAETIKLEDKPAPAKQPQKGRKR